MIADSEGLALTDDGMKALLELGRGDMRKFLNILQSTAMAFSVLDAKAIYNCTGNPDPEFIDRITELLLSMNFNEIYAEFNQQKVSQGFSLTDIIRELNKSVIEIKFPEKMKIFLIKRMSEIEMRLSQGANEKIQLGALVGAFVESRQITLQ